MRITAVVEIETTKKAKSEKRLQMNIDRDLHKRFKTLCLANDLEMTDVVTEFVSDWCSKNGG